MAARKTEFIVEPGKPSVIMTRVFDAPRRLVFEAMTKPEYMKRWYGPHGYTVTLCENDLRVGGAYRMVHRGPDGIDYGFHGVNREIVVPERVVYTWIFDLMPDKEALVTATFDERDGKTTLTSTTVFQSVEDRDGFIATGATEGGSQSMDRLAEMLATMV